ncbi:hypothetical protein, partial [Vibrio parahaemolyticus]|uniref:hypothetical protein n=1 Tax=Vibrio parahaemolyticus TaxID=670 RepID=UPI002905E2DF
HKPEQFKIEVRKANQKHTDFNSKHSALAAFSSLATNAALRCEQRLAILERSETAKRCESLLNALLYD